MLSCRQSLIVSQEAILGKCNCEANLHVLKLFFVVLDFILAQLSLVCGTMAGRFYLVVVPTQWHDNIVVPSASQVCMYHACHLQEIGAPRSATIHALTDRVMLLHLSKVRLCALETRKLEAKELTLAQPQSSLLEAGLL